MPGFDLVFSGWQAAYRVGSRGITDREPGVVHHRNGGTHPRVNAALRLDDDFRFGEDLRDFIPFIWHGHIEVLVRLAPGLHIVKGRIAIEKIHRLSDPDRNHPGLVLAIHLIEDYGSGRSRRDRFSFLSGNHPDEDVLDLSVFDLDVIGINDGFILRIADRRKRELLWLRSQPLERDHAPNAADRACRRSGGRHRCSWSGRRRRFRVSGVFAGQKHHRQNQNSPDGSEELGSGGIRQADHEELTDGGACRTDGNQNLPIVGVSVGVRKVIRKHDEDYG